jgi:hypothetical protein
VSINLTIFPTEAPADLFWADGSKIRIDPQTEKFVQLPSGSYCTIVSTAKNEETGEHPPTGEKLAEAMIAFWQGFAQKIREEAGAPTATRE